LASETSFDVAVVGGGIVGMATAMALSGRGFAVAVLEAEATLAAHQSGHNSGVVHSGLYYRPGSRKARLCVEGAAELYRFCEEEGIACRQTGKLVLATRAEELPALDELARRGAANGLAGVARLGPEEIREREPHAAGLAALHVPQTGVADFPGVVRACARRVEAAGGKVLTGARVEGIARSPGAGGRGSRTVVETRRGTFDCALLVNCAGLQADRVARLAGLEPALRIIPFRGEYWELVPERRDLVRALLYPVPDPRFPFLGVHFTRRVDDRVEAGPNAVLALKREGYRWSDVALRDLAETAAWPGFWRFLGREWRTAVDEVWRSTVKRAFVAGLQRLVPEVRGADLVRGGSGVRAQALDRAGRLVDDFSIERGEGSLHVLNAPSPAATACLAIGGEIAGMAVESLDRG
jgi:(S)-2-hydroxyglutarate dehydrogenase